MDAFLLGAGFSHAVNDEMPLTRELGLEVANELVRRGHDITLLSGLYRNDFEAWLTHLAEGRPWTSEADSLRDRAMFLDASLLVAQVIEDAQRRRAIDRPRWLSHLVTWWHQNESVVLTLNYDTIIEETVQALLLPSGGAGPVHYSSIYAVPISSSRLRRGGISEVDDQETLRLLKLHGSINWYYSGSDSPHGETVYEGGLTRGWDSKRIWAVGDRDLDLLVDKVPYVVPPTGTKSSFFNNETIRAQWSVANQFCWPCRMVVMGYSLPEADHLMRLFIEQSVRDRALTLVDSDPNIGEHFRKLLPGFDVDETWVGTSDTIQRFVEGLSLIPV